ncbi:MAG TPA: hypothetical protein VGS22_11985 [Thermoanaerobaculia bacterium]|nr:hypothetical protein [Thermoanaerobaculia bacterium]
MSCHSTFVRSSCFALVLLGVLGTGMVVPPVLFAADPAVLGSEVYEGFDLDRLAKALARLTTLRTQYGEKEGNAAFQRWLAEQGSSRKEYERAYSSWFERFRADSSGQLEARFQMLNSRYVTEENFADTPDRSQEVRGGMTLDRYAQIAVALSRPPGADVTKVLAKFGIKSQAEWKKATDAWVAAMREDTSFGVSQQYGALYQKYASRRSKTRRCPSASSCAAGSTGTREHCAISRAPSKTGREEVNRAGTGACRYRSID